MRRLANWAFFSGNIVTADGGPIRVGPARSGDTALLWSRKNGVWFLMEAEVGFTDVIYLEWSDKHGYPRSYRVTGNAVAMGEAAGVACAVAAREKVLPHEVPFSALGTKAAG